MAGDLTLQVLADMAASGRLKDRDFSPFERKSMLELSMTLKWYYSSKLRDHVSQVLMANFATQVSMAVANRKEYPSAVDAVSAAIDQYIHYSLLGNRKKESEEVDTSWQTSLARFWEQCYGVPLIEANQRGL